jgi:hypothetical protein
MSAFMGTVWWSILCGVAGGILALAFRPFIMKVIGGCNPFCKNK